MNKCEKIGFKSLTLKVYDNERQNKDMLSYYMLVIRPCDFYYKILTFEKMVTFRKNYEMSQNREIVGS